MSTGVEGREQGGQGNAGLVLGLELWSRVTLNPRFVRSSSGHP